jgi:hypothetical protein
VVEVDGSRVFVEVADQMVQELVVVVVVVGVVVVERPPE